MVAQVLVINIQDLKVSTITLNMAKTINISTEDGNILKEDMVDITNGEVTEVVTLIRYKDHNFYCVDVFFF